METTEYSPNTQEKTTIDSITPNIALIFAGGRGRRMNNNGRPKQFLELKGKPIIIYTLEVFQSHPEIDGIIVACVEDWIPDLKDLIKHFNIDKVIKIVPGGESGQDSIYNAIIAASEIYPEDTTVLIHDGVRPLINHKTISDNIDCVRRNRSCITCVPTIETFVVKQDDSSLKIPQREDSLIARAPQSFVLKDIHFAHEKARNDGCHDFIDSCSLMNYYHYPLATIMGPIENIKITTPMDYFVFKTMTEVNEIQQVFGF